jgi:hypothetical protein
MLMAALEDVGEGENFEQLWTRRVADDLFELCCIPFFAYGMALGDVVRAEASSGYVVQEVLRRSGNGVARVAITRRDSEHEVHAKVHDLLGRLEYLCEWYETGYVAVSLDNAFPHDELFVGLAALGDAVAVERLLT